MAGKHAARPTPTLFDPASGYECPFVSDHGLSSAAREPFNARVMIWVIAAAIIAVVAFLFLSTYAPEIPDGDNGGGHALSKSAVGYAGFVKLEAERGIHVDMATDESALKTSGLLVLTP